jgi:pimeloyl-ACP methyl ester carboxylesterase
MTDTKNQEPAQRGMDRRDVLTGVGLVAATAALAVTGPADAAAPVNFTTSEYWTQKGNVKLYLYRKRLAGTAPGAAQPVLFLVHGSSISGRSSFDLATPGLGEYSLMNVFARYGYDVWTMDFEGYGRSTVTPGNSDIKSGVADLAAAAAVVARETGQRRMHLWGESSGGLRAAAFAAAYPDRAGRLVLGAFTYTGKGSPTLADRSKQLAFYRANNRRPRDITMIRSIFTRDKAGTSDPRVGDVLAAAELPHGDTVPTGTYLDMTANLPVVDPKKVQSPVLLLRGEYDGIATEEDLTDFFRQLPNPDRQFVILPGIAHSLQFAVNRALVWHAGQAFLSLPPAKTV